MLDARNAAGMRQIKLTNYSQEYRKQEKQDGMRSEIQAKLYITRSKAKSLYVIQSIIGSPWRVLKQGE